MYYTLETLANSLVIAPNGDEKGKVTGFNQPTASLTWDELGFTLFNDSLLGMPKVQAQAKIAWVEADYLTLWNDAAHSTDPFWGEQGSTLAQVFLLLGPNDKPTGRWWLNLGRSRPVAGTRRSLAPPSRRTFRIACPSAHRTSRGRPRRRRPAWARDGRADRPGTTALRRGCAALPRAAADRSRGAGANVRPGISGPAPAPLPHIGPGRQAQLGIRACQRCARPGACEIASRTNAIKCGSSSTRSLAGNSWLQRSIPQNVVLAD